MKRWALGLVGAVLALALAIPLLLETIEQTSCGGTAADVIGGPAGQQPASGGFSAENVTIAKAAALEANTRRLPARALVVILATGFQESGIRNLDHGDRDSVGWLQQRAGWGSVAERMNPQVAAGKFYDHLVRVPGWETLPVTVAAQRVQISAFPDAYAKWQAKAEQLAALVGVTGAGGPAGVAADGLAGGACTGMPAVRIATWNSYYGSRYTSTASALFGTARIAWAMSELADEADVIGGQEFSEASHKKAAMDALGDGWSAVFLDTSHPVFYRTTFEVVSSESVPVFTRGTPMEGPDQGDRYVNTVVLRELATGKTVTEVNFHQIPTIQKNGKLNQAWPKRTAVARRIFTAATDSARAHIAQGSPVLVTCDCNYDGDPDGMFTAAGLASTGPLFAGAKQATRTRDIDQILYAGGVPVSAKVLPAFGSDHSARVVTFPATASGGAAAGGGPVPATFNQQGNPRTVEQAVAWMQANMPHGALGEPVLNACERYQNLAYGLPGGYATALAHWNAPGPRSTGYSSPPRGALVFWRSGNPAGHVALSLGNGIVVSTDYNSQTHRYQAGMLSAGPITDIDKWGERLGWRAPNFHVGSEAA